MKKKRFIFPICLMLSLSGCVMYNGLPPEEAEHQHEYANEYSFDENEHWFAATCEHTEQRKGVEKHSFGEYVVTQEATLSKEGLKIRTCSVCGYKDEVAIPKTGEENQQGNGQITTEWTITGINVNTENIEITVGDNPISVVPTIFGEGKFPTSLAVYCADGTITKTVDGEQVTENFKIAEISSNVVESGSAFTVKAIAAGNTKITISSIGKTDISKEINVTVNPKVEHHELTLSETAITMNKGSIRVLGASSTDDIVWSSSNEEIVSLENKTNTGVWLKSLKATTDDPVVITATICRGTSYELVKTCVVTVVSNEQTVFDYYFINNQLLTDLHLYMWGECGTNADWPGVPLGERTYRDTYLNDVYKITIDKDAKPYEKMIISGKDSNGEFLQTDDIILDSFKTQNAFSIPEIPSAGADGVRKASIRMSTFNPSTDALQDGSIRFSMNEVTLVVGETINVICYSTEDVVNYEIISGSDKVELPYHSSVGFNVKALAAGNAVVKASITVDGETYSATLNVTVKEDEEVTYYFANKYLWTNVRVYLWGNKGSNGDFPGGLFKEAPVLNADGVKTFKLTFSKNFDGYTHMIVSGTDGEHGWSKTADIDFASIPEGKNMIYITETSWDKFDFVGEDKINICSYDFGVFETSTPRINIEEDSKVVAVNSTVDISVSTNSEFEIINSDDTVVEVTKGADKITIKGLKVGTATITAKVDDTTSDSITITVIEDTIVRYYFVNNYKWTDLKVYMWRDSPKTENAEFPGVSLGERAFVDRNGNDVYSISFAQHAEGYEGIIISGFDAAKNASCQTEDILVSGFNDDNGFEISGWKNEENHVASISYGFYTYELYLNIAKDVEFAEGGSVPLTVATNGENVVYEITSGNDVIELQNESDSGVTIYGKSAGNATFTATVNDGSNTVVKTVNVKVIADEDVTYYFSNNYCWTNLSVHLWKSETEYKDISLTSTTLKNKEGQDVYKISFKKNTEAYTNMVIMGHDNTYEDVQTEDLSFTSFGENNNVYLDGWNNGKAVVAYASYDPNFVEVSEGSPKTICLNESFEITISSNFDVSYAVDIEGIVSITRTGNVFEIEGVTAGTVTITFFNGTKDNKIDPKTYTVTVKAPTIYTINLVPDEYLEFNAKLYIWAWDSEDNGAWYSCEYNNGTITFSSAKDNLVGAIVVRFNPELSGEPSFSSEYYWNQSPDLVITNYVASF